jgi:phosphatidylserine synthase
MEWNPAPAILLYYIQFPSFIGAMNLMYYYVICNLSLIHFETTGTKPIKLQGPDEGYPQHKKCTTIWEKWTASIFWLTFVSCNCWHKDPVFIWFLTFLNTIYYIEFLGKIPLLSVKIKSNSAMKVSPLLGFTSARLEQNSAIWRNANKATTDSHVNRRHGTCLYKIPQAWTRRGPEF